MNEAIVRLLLRHGDLDNAMQHVQRQLPHIRTDRERQAAHCLMADIELRRNTPIATRRAADLLRPLVMAAPSLLTQADRTAHIRLLTTLAVAVAYAGRDELTFKTKEAQGYLTQAHELLGPDGDSEHAELLFAESIVDEQRAMYIMFTGAKAGRPSDETHRRASLYKTRAEIALLSAFSIWRVAHCWDRLRDGLELQDSRPWGGLLPAQGGHMRGDFFPWLVALRDYWRLASPERRERLDRLDGWVDQLYEWLARQNAASKELMREYRDLMHTHDTEPSLQTLASSHGTRVVSLQGAPGKASSKPSKAKKVRSLS
ncbi:MAG: hypothetical protein HYR74_09005 [Candidatus Eisenbacteria bacterium]|nr:hypothetical protein [Candidatus Eisenbacteria bacterium]